MNLLDKFDMVEVKNDQRISERDKEVCERWQESYNETLTAYKTALQSLLVIKDKYGEDHYTENSYSLLRWDTLDNLEKAIKKLRSSFIGKIVSHFEKDYSVTIDNDNIKEKYDDSVTYENIVDEIFVQLGGLNFNEKAELEIKNSFVDSVTGYNGTERFTIKGKKLSLEHFAYIDHIGKKWGTDRLSYSARGNLNSLFKALNLYETNNTEQHWRFNHLINDLMRGEGDAVFTKHAMNLNKVKSIRVYKNSRVDIEFASSEQLLSFVNEFIRSVKAA